MFTPGNLPATAQRNVKIDGILELNRPQPD